MQVRKAYNGPIFLDLALPEPSLGALCGSNPGQEPVQYKANNAQEADRDCCQGLHMPCTLVRACTCILTVVEGIRAQPSQKF